MGEQDVDRDIALVTGDLDDPGPILCAPPACLPRFSKDPIS